MWVIKDGEMGYVMNCYDCFVLFVLLKNALLG